MNSTITILDLKIIVITVRWRGLEGWRRSEVRVVGAGWMDGDRERGSGKGAHYRSIPYSGNASTPGVEFGGKRGPDRW